MARPPRWKPQQMQAALAAYERGDSMKEIAQYGVPWGTVLSYLERAGIPRRPLGRPKGGERTYVDPRSGYVLVYAPDHPHRGQRRSPVMGEHRRVMELHLGRQLGRFEVVHHRDHNKQNNALENLELMTLGEHSRLHREDEKRAGIRHERNFSLHAC